jgi:hypothetical protein
MYVCYGSYPSSRIASSDTSDENKTTQWHDFVTLKEKRDIGAASSI